jgi:hypothetical protein
MKRWSKLKSQFEDLLAPSLRGRLRIHVTEYSKASLDIGRAWLTFDGQELTSIQVPSFCSDTFRFSTTTLDFGQAIGEYVKLSVQDARNSQDELIQGLAFLDRRFGKRSLRGVVPEDLHPFSRYMYTLRCYAHSSADGNKGT